MKIRSPIVDSNNFLNQNFPSFDSLNIKLSLGFYLVDTFSDCLSFHSVNQKDTNVKIAHYNKLNHIYENSLIDQNTVLIISNTSVKNNITMSVSHIYRDQDIIIKTVYYAMNVTSTEAELFTIRCSINYVTQIQDVAYIIVITDAISATKCIFNISIHPYQLYLIVISKDLITQFCSRTVLVTKSDLLIF